MSLETAIRDAFIASANGRLDLTNFTMATESHGRRLTFTGFYSDGDPFAQTCAPFTGDPILRAYQMAQDILSTHIGARPMPAPAAIAGLAVTLREQLKAAAERASNLGLRAAESVNNLHTVLDTAENVVSDIDTAAADVQAALGLSTNGGPKLGE